MRQARGAARLREAERDEDQDRHLARPAHDDEVPGRDAGQPGRPGRLRARPLRPRPVRAGRRRRQLRLDRLRPARRRRQRAQGVVRQRLLRLRPPALRPGQPRAERRLVREDGAYTDALRQEERPDPGPPDDGGLGQRHGEHPQGARREEDQLLRLLVRHLPRPGLRHALPDRLRRVVFDGTVDPRKIWYDANLDQDVAFDDNINIWFDWVAKHDDAYHLGTTQKAVRRCSTGPRRSCTPNPAKGEGGKLGGSEWTDAFLYAGYYQSTWTGLAETFSSSCATTTSTPSRRPTSTPTGRRRQRLRGLPRRAVHGHAVVADEVVHLGARQLEGVREGAVRDLVQRLVQRAVPALAGEGRTPR